MSLKIEHILSEMSMRVYYEGEYAGYLTYEISNGIFDIQHTVVRSEFRGKGLGRILVDFAAEYAKKEGLEVVPSCSYAERVLNGSG